MRIRADRGTVSTVLRYDINDKNPSAVLFAIAYPSRSVSSTRRSASHIIATVKRQMAPEFHVVGDVAFEEDRFALFFVITQSQGPPTRHQGR
jgi:hypothetical protein